MNIITQNKRMQFMIQSIIAGSSSDRSIRIFGADGVQTVLRCDHFNILDALGQSLRIKKNTVGLTDSESLMLTLINDEQDAVSEGIPE